MIPFEKAYEIVMAEARVLPPEPVPLEQALHRVLAQDVTADADMPPFDKSAMDGYACRRADLHEILRVIEAIPAGVMPGKAIGHGECAKIMTGAPVPEGADCVIMCEYSEPAGPHHIRFTGENTADNLCRQGEDVRAGTVVLTTGTRLGPQHIAVLAAVGCAIPSMYRQARVGVIATGNELVEPPVRPSGAQIRNSNSWQLMAQIAGAGAIPTYYGIAADTLASTDALLEKGLRENDVMLLSGGVSEGDFDLVPEVLTRRGFEILFDAIAIKPGKPATFARGKPGVCFGLPGNPVSTFVLFEVLVKPFLRTLMGEYPPVPLTWPMPLASPLVRKGGERAAWIPVRFNEEGGMDPCEYHGSAHIHALCHADGLAYMPIGTTSMEKGQAVHVRSIRP